MSGGRWQQQLRAGGGQRGLDSVAGPVTYLAVHDGVLAVDDNLAGGGDHERGHHGR